MGGTDFEMCIAIKFEKFVSSFENGGGVLRLGPALFWFAGAARLAFRTNDKVDRAVVGLRLIGNNTTTAEFDVVWMGAKGEQRLETVRGFRYRLHRSDQWGRGLQK